MDLEPLLRLALSWSLHSFGSPGPWKHHSSLLLKGSSWLAPGPTEDLGAGKYTGVVSQASGATSIAVDLPLTEQSQQRPFFLCQAICRQEDTHEQGKTAWCVAMGQRTGGSMPFQGEKKR